VLQEIKPLYNKPTVAVPKTHDFDEILPIALIRAHTKTDDVETISDAQLLLYRQGAIEAAEAYTGLLLQKQRLITDEIDNPPYMAGRDEPWFWHRTEYAFAESFGWYYGFSARVPVNVRVKIGARRAKLPIVANAFGHGCCNPELSTGESGRFMYLAGFSCVSDLPSAFTIGCLKYIAHLVENPGDIVVATTASKRPASGLTVSDPANPVIASGAAEMWRTMNPDAI
jgi:hypothetical protein